MDKKYLMIVDLPAKMLQPFIDALSAFSGQQIDWGVTTGKTAIWTTGNHDIARLYIEAAIPLIELADHTHLIEMKMANHINSSRKCWSYLTPDGTLIDHPETIVEARKLGLI